MDTVERFWRKVDKSDECWLWTGGDTGNGLFYGKFWDGNRKVLAHRFAYNLFNGEIPERMEVDHTCRTPKCVRPEHLVIVTRTENMRNRDDYRTKGDGIMVCNRGHLMTEELKYIRKDGRIECRDCIRFRYFAKVKETEHR
jgi:hypothetical protein